jgi:hypothetical protein
VGVIGLIKTGGLVGVAARNIPLKGLFTNTVIVLKKANDFIGKTTGLTEKASEALKVATRLGGLSTSAILGGRGAYDMLESIACVDGICFVTIVDVETYPRCAKIS